MSWITNELAKAKQSTLYRKLPNYQIHHTKIIASSNDYLGFANDPRVNQAAKECIDIYGTGSTGSRLTTGNYDLHERLEKEIAYFKNMEACLLYSSGYLANIGVLTLLANKKTIIFSDEYNHASLIDGCRLSGATIVVYEHNNMEDLANKIESYYDVSNKIILTDGVFSMDGDLAPLDLLHRIKEKYNALLIVDDAHGTGVIGSSGRGTSEHYSITPDIVIGTLSKALGCEGGFVCANKETIQYLIQKSRPFIFQTALSPGMVGAALKSLHLMQVEKRHVVLQEKAANIRQHLIKHHFTVPEGITPIIPILLKKDELALKMQQQLELQNIFIPAIRPPTVPKDMSRLRCTIQATHRCDELTKIKDAFEVLSMQNNFNIS